MQGIVEERITRAVNNKQGAQKHAPGTLKDGMAVDIFRELQ